MLVESLASNGWLCYGLTAALDKEAEICVLYLLKKHLTFLKSGRQIINKHTGVVPNWQRPSHFPFMA
jgi:hypothetical protein